MLMSASGHFSGLCSQAFCYQDGLEQRGSLLVLLRIPKGMLLPGFRAAEEGVGMSEVAGQERKQKWKSSDQNKEMESCFLSSQCWV